ncbi:nucleotidyltransferase domain-containing protein [bacterium]
MIELNNEKTKIIINELKQQIKNIQCIYIFGSFAKGEINLKSDIDIAVLAKSKIANNQKWEMAQDLAVKLKRDVDLVELRYTTTVLAMQVIKNGIKIYCADTKECTIFEDFIFSEYIMRKDILNDKLSA